MATQPHFLGSMTLKALLEDPNLKNPPLIGQSGNRTKIKKEDGSDTPQYNYGSAFLGPTLWDKSYGSDINLEYMDLDEFLSENNIPILEEDGISGNSPRQNVENSPRQYLRTPPLSPQFMKSGGSTAGPSVASPPSYPPQSPSASSEASESTSSSPPGSPFKVDFQVSEQDLALTAIPDYKDQGFNPNAQGWIHMGDDHRPKLGSAFDPRKRNFSEEELKPQPIVKKSKKIFVPDDLKDDKYWARRLKNNYAAKRSRDARRVKENQIALRAAYLEKENKCLKEEMSKLRKENAKLKSIATKYEPAAVDSVAVWPSLST